MINWTGDGDTGLPIGEAGDEVTAGRENPMAGRDDLDADPVILAALARDGETIADIHWSVTSIWSEDGHEVQSAHREGSCVMDLKIHRDQQADWFATIHWGRELSYHAQRGRRSITLRRDLPESVSATLVGMPASRIADVPGLEALMIVETRTSAAGSSTIVVKPFGCG